MLFSVADWISLSLPSRPTTSQAESGFSFFSHFRSFFFSCQCVSLILCWTGVHSTLCVAAWRCLGVGCPPEPVCDFEY